MCRVLVSLLLFSLLACSIAIDQTDDQNFAQLDARYAQFDARLRGMAGANERQLLGAMGRIPDTSYQVGDQTNVLQWCGTRPARAVRPGEGWADIRQARYARAFASLNGPCLKAPARRTTGRATVADLSRSNTTRPGA
jgi:hypothetical protein